MYSCIMFYKLLTPEILMEMRPCPLFMDIVLIMNVFSFSKPQLKTKSTAIVFENICLQVKGRQLNLEPDNFEFKDWFDLVLLGFKKLPEN